MLHAPTQVAQPPRFLALVRLAGIVGEAALVWPDDTAGSREGFDLNCRGPHRENEG